jgi:hypothetical protein
MPNHPSLKSSTITTIDRRHLFGAVQVVNYAMPHLNEVLAHRTEAVLLHRKDRTPIKGGRKSRSAAESPVICLNHTRGAEAN